MPYRSDNDRYSRRSGSENSSRSRSGSGQRSSYRRSSTTRSSNRYPQFDYDLERSSRSERSSRRRPYQKKSWVIGSWRFTERTIYIFVSFILLLVLLVVAISSLRSCSRKKDPVPVAETSTGESYDESVVEPEMTIPPAESWEGMADIDNKPITADLGYVYGSHLYFEGTMDTLPQVTNIQLVLRPVHQAIDLATWDMEWYNEGSSTHFASGPTLTSGPCLETFPVGQYALLVKLTASTGDVLYRPLTDQTEMDPIDYYTITREGKNNKVDLKMLNDPAHNISFWGFDVVESELPDYVYDFIIDPGHGGNDTGCSSADGKHYERDIVMQVCQKAYDDLTAMGYKVMMTRDGTEGEDRWMAFEFFDNPGGRVTISYEAKAKYLLSVHINTVERSEVHGYQVFGSVRSDMSWAKMIGEAIDADTNMEPNSATYNSVAPGVLFRTLDDLYDEGLFNNTDYLLMIREIGGAATGANQTAFGEYQENIYRFETQALEGTLMEMGFMSNEGDLKIMVDEWETFSQVIVDSYLKLIATFAPLDPSTAPEAVLSPTARAAATESTDNSAEPLGEEPTSNTEESSTTSESESSAE